MRTSLFFSLLLWLPTLGSVESSAKPSEAGAQVQEEHLKRILTADAEFPGFPPALAVSSDGQVAVPMPWKQTVGVYSPQGQRLRELGGPGEEVGEFRRLSMLGWLGDTLWVADHVLFRVTFFPPPTYEPQARQDPVGYLRGSGMRVPLPTATGSWVSVRRVADPTPDEGQVEEWVTIDAEWGHSLPNGQGGCTGEP